MNTNQVVIISGGSRGLGAHIAEDLLKHNYKIATFSRSKSESIEKLIKKDPDETHYLWRQLDLEDTKRVKSFVIDVYKKLGGINALVNNAGMNHDALLPMTDDASIDRLLSVNLKSAILLSRSVIRIMLKQNQGGSIVNIGSILGSRGFNGTSVYSATKAALEGLSRSLARELGDRNIRVNTIAPGFIQTDMTQNMTKAHRNQILRRTPLSRLGTVEDISSVVNFLLSPKSQFITGQTITVDGGLTC